MKKYFYAFVLVLDQIKKDSMLLLVCLVPFICGFLFKFGVPAVLELFQEKFLWLQVLPQYYLILDLLTALMAPFMFCFAAAMVILAEVDDGISRYLAVTPVGIRGYLFSRIGIPAIISILVSFLLLSLLSLTHIAMFFRILLALFSALQGVVIAMLIVSFSGNKLEGMAAAKLSGLVMAGIPVPFVLTGKIQYLTGILPSFWITKGLKEQNLMLAVVSILVLAVWLYTLYKKFHRKITGS